MGQTIQAKKLMQNTKVQSNYLIMHQMKVQGKLVNCGQGTLLPLQVCLSLQIRKEKIPKNKMFMSFCSLGGMLKFLKVSLPKAKHKNHKKSYSFMISS